MFLPRQTGGDTPQDILITSTLASQATPAVGRAIGSQVAAMNNVDSAFPKDSVSYVSVGDGSINNAHFLSAVNLAEYARHRGMPCPVIFGIAHYLLEKAMKNCVLESQQ